MSCLSVSSAQRDICRSIGAETDLSNPSATAQVRLASPLATSTMAGHVPSSLSNRLLISSIPPISAAPDPATLSGEGTGYSSTTLPAALLAAFSLPMRTTLALTSCSHFSISSSTTRTSSSPLGPLFLSVRRIPLSERENDPARAEDGSGTGGSADGAGRVRGRR